MLVGLGCLTLNPSELDLLCLQPTLGLCAAARNTPERKLLYSGGHGHGSGSHGSSYGGSGSGYHRGCATLISHDYDAKMMEKHARQAASRGLCCALCCRRACLRTSTLHCICEHVLLAWQLTFSMMRDTGTLATRAAAVTTARTGKLHEISNGLAELVEWNGHDTSLISHGNPLG